MSTSAASYATQFPGYGSSQAHRLLPQLSPDFVKVMEKSPEQLIVFLQDFAEMVRYFSLQNEVSGTWKQLLEHDISFTLAAVSGFSLSAQPARESALKTAFDHSNYFPDQEKLIVEMYQLALELAGALASWLGKVSGIMTNETGKGHAAQVQEFLQPIYTELETQVKANVPVDIYFWVDCWKQMSALFQTPPDAIAGTSLVGETQAIMPVFLAVFDGTAKGKPPVLSDYASQFNYLNRLASGLLRAASAIQGIVPDLLQEAVRYPAHQPHNAILLAFLSMMEPLTDEMNGLSARHLDFYYREVLRLEPLPARPDRVFLNYVLKQGAAPALVPAGTQLVAGKSADGTPVTFATEQDLYVNNIQLSAAKTIYNGGVEAAVAASKQLYAAPIADSVDGRGGKGPALWPPFGEDQAGLAPGQTTMELAQVGLAISSPAFFLASGTRRVNLFFELSPATFPLLTDALFPYTSDKENIFQLFARIFGESFQIACSAPKGWQELSLDADPALCFPGYTCDKVIAASGGFKMQLTLPANLPAWGAVSEKVHGPGYPEGLPALRILIDQNAVTEVQNEEQDSWTVSAYNFLAGQQVSQVDVAVRVTGYTGFIASTAAGAFPPNKPFTPFGTQPIQNAAFYLASAEVFRKRLTGLKLQVTWKNLPTTDNGFADYYAAYNELSPDTPFNNAVFRLGFDLLNEQSWVDLPPQAQPGQVGAAATDFPLFQWTTEAEEELESGKDKPPARDHQTAKKSGKTASPRPAVDWLVMNVTSDRGSRFRERIQYQLVEEAAELEGNGKLEVVSAFDGFALSGLPPVGEESPGEQLGGYTPEAFSGFLRLRLTEPSYAFGFGLYTDVLTTGAQNNMRSIIAATRPGSPPPASDIQFSKTPKPPFAPQIKQVEGDYAATDTIGWTAGGTFQGGVSLVQPFGVTPLTPEGGTFPLLPDFTEEGYLYLGLSGVSVPDVVTLLVQVDESTGNFDLEPPPVSWSWLKGAEWVEFEQPEVADGTNGFLTSGVLSFQLNGQPAGTGASPGYLIFNGDTADSGLYWIRGTVAGNAAAVCRVTAIQTQAGSAVRVMNGEPVTAVPAGTITKFVQPLPAISKVIQPMASFGGRPAETTEGFYTRVSERLRHKERAVTAWDLERICLQQFPQVGLARCFNHSREGQTQAPGHTLLTVFPATIVAGSPNQFNPRINQNELQEIRDYFRDKTVGMMQLDVRNPDFEYVQVFAEVDLVQGAAPGPSLQQLNLALQQRIAPWVNEPEKFNPFQTRVSYAGLLEFIKKQPYVADVQDFQVFIYENPGDPVYFAIPDEFDPILPRWPWTILTTATRHLLYDAAALPREMPQVPVGPIIVPQQRPGGLGQMVIPAGGGKKTGKNRNLGNCVVIRPEVYTGGGTHE